MTDLRQLLGIQLPIIQAPMAGAQDHALAVAVSESGGLGSLPCAMLSPEKMRQEISSIQKQTARPFNVNFFCHQPPSPDPKREGEWRKALEPYYRELGVELSSFSAVPPRLPFNEDALAVVTDLKPPVVSFHFGLPSEALLAPVRAYGAKILGCATTVEEARWLEARGVDAIIAQGLEAGGHRGMFLTRDPGTQLGTIALVRRIVEAVKTPVIAAGGIADAKGVAAAFALGAWGVQVGTAYLLCPEARIASVYREALATSEGTHTVLTNVFSGGLARGFLNRAIRELGPVSTVAPGFPLAAAAISPLRAKAEAMGSGDFSPLWSGQNPKGARAVPAGEITRGLFEERAEESG